MIDPEKLLRKNYSVRPTDKELIRYLQEEIGILEVA